MGDGVNAVLNLDDNLVNGHAYTFVFQCNNLLSNPSVQVIWADLTNNAPDFLEALNIVQETGSSNTNYYNVAFTYSGDGSDVVQDVITAMISAFQAGSSDSFAFLVGFGANIPTYSASGGGNSAGVSYSFSPLNIIEPVTPGQQSQYVLEAREQVQAVGTSPGGQVATVATVNPTTGVSSFQNAITVQAAGAAANVDQISGDANKAAAASTSWILLAVAAALGLFVYYAPRPKVSVGA